LLVEHLVKPDAEMLQMTLQGKSTDDFPKGNNKTAYVKALAVLEHLVGHFPS